MRWREREREREGGWFSRSPAAARSHPLSTRSPFLSTEGKPLPTELRRDAASLKRAVDLEDDNTAVPRTHVDDEYARAAEREPKVWRRMGEDGEGDEWMSLSLSLSLTPHASLSPSFISSSSPPPGTRPPA